MNRRPLRAKRIVCLWFMLLSSFILTWSVAFGAVNLPKASAAEDFNGEASTAVSVLQGWYNGSTYNSTGWWNSANALEATIDYMMRSGTTTYLSDLTNTYNANHSGNFLNNYYDDEGWWALAWIKAYDLTGDSNYLNQARTIFTDMTGGWDNTCGGGIWWSKDRNYKNAIANELFLTVAAKLHNRVSGDSTYYNWANQEWNWFKNSGMINSSNLINDGLTSGCANNGQTTWTYNQGVILGGLVEWNSATNDALLLTTAQNIANAVINSTTLTKNGILTEPCETSGCGGDGTQFKGIFMRYLKVLYDRDLNASYQTYMQNNAHSVWANNRNASNQLGLKWAGPFDATDASRQSSALDVLNTQVTETQTTDLALGKSASANGTSCATTESPAQAVDGNTTGTKWCQGGSGGQTLTIDLGSAQSISQIFLYFAGSGGEDPGYNIRDYNLQIGDGTNWTTVVTKFGNISNVTSHDFKAISGRYIRFNIINSQTSTINLAARLYELTARGDAVVSQYEAEYGTLHNLSIESVYSGFTGTGYVAGWNTNGQWVDLNVTVPADGTYKLIFRYAGGAGNASRYVFANGGGVMDNQTFPGTGGWGSYSTVTVSGVSLKAGSNTVSLIYNSSKGSTNYLNFDNLVVSK
jgi:predicted alpha-1,6-mannanase (GH76 family)